MFVDPCEIGLKSKFSPIRKRGSRCGRMRRSSIQVEERLLFNLDRSFLAGGTNRTVRSLLAWMSSRENLQIRIKYNVLFYLM